MIIATQFNDNLNNIPYQIKADIHQDSHKEY